jgi:hypothetical protein
MSYQQRKSTCPSISCASVRASYLERPNPTHNLSVRPSNPLSGTGHPQAQRPTSPSPPPCARYLEMGSAGMENPIQQGTSLGSTAGWGSFVTSYWWMEWYGWDKSANRFSLQLGPLPPPPSTPYEPKCSPSRHGVDLWCRAWVRPERWGGEDDICVEVGDAEGVGCRRGC